MQRESNRRYRQQGWVTGTTYVRTWQGGPLCHVPAYRHARLLLVESGDAEQQDSV